MDLLYKRKSTLFELKWKKLKNKENVEGRYSFVKFLDTDLGIVIPEYTPDNEILQSVIKNNTRKIINDEED